MLHKRSPLNGSGNSELIVAAYHALMAHRPSGSHPEPLIEALVIWCWAIDASDLNQFKPSNICWRLRPEHQPRRQIRRGAPLIRQVLARSAGAHARALSQQLLECKTDTRTLRWLSSSRPSQPLPMNRAINSCWAQAFQALRRGGNAIDAYESGA